MSGCGHDEDMLRLKAAAEYAHGRADEARAVLEAVEAVTGGNQPSIIRGVLASRAETMSAAWVRAQSAYLKHLDAAEAARAAS
jgi:hypothetical protein